MAMVTSTIGYSLMLVAMTFNAYLFISVILGFGIGTLCCGHWTEPARSHGSEPLAAHTASEVASSRWSGMQPPLLAVKGASHLLRVDGMTCDGWINFGWTCSLAEDSYSCDCSGCECASDGDEGQSYSYSYDSSSSCPSLAPIAYKA